jgi:SMI1-KNR4 cell-wall
MLDFVADTRLPPPPAARIERLQDNFENRFPKAYLDFLALNNGAKLKNSEVMIDNRNLVIERFLPIVADPKVDADGWADVAVVATQLDARLATDEDATRLDLIPIAATFAGDFIVLDYRKNRENPSVALWDHELSDDMMPQTEALAPSFGAFLDMLN